jgi:hypothetical protein
VWKVGAGAQVIQFKKATARNAKMQNPRKYQKHPDEVSGFSDPRNKS